MDWKQLIDREQMVKWRRHLHQFPEIAYQEKETSNYIAAALSDMGDIEILRPTETSVVGVLKGGKPGKIIGIRADIDALPLQEEADVPFKSVHDGIMHACGHDIHTATLLGVAKALSQLREHLNGTVKFIFQPAEEQFPGGAQAIVDSGVVSDCDYFLGAHVLAQLKTGVVSCWPGAVTAAPDRFTVHIRGTGSHGAAPEASIDVVTVAAHIVTNLNSIVSRNISPYENVVLSVTRFIADSSLNILGPNVELGGTIRTKNNTIRHYVHKRMDEIISGICSAYGATYELSMVEGYAPVINDPYLTEVVQTVVKEQLGEDQLVHPNTLMAGDDYSAFGQIAPTVFFLVGSGCEEEGYPYLVHNPKYVANEDILPITCQVFLASVFKLLEA